MPDNETSSVASDPSAILDVLASLTAVSNRERAASGEVVEPPAKQACAISAARAVPSDSDVMGRRLSVSVQNGDLSAKRALAAARWIDKEIRKLIAAIVAHGVKGSDGAITILFGKLFVDTQDSMEALAGMPFFSYGLYLSM